MWGWRTGQMSLCSLQTGCAELVVSATGVPPGTGSCCHHTSSAPGAAWGCWAVNAEAWGGNTWKLALCQLVCCDLSSNFVAFLQQKIPNHCDFGGFFWCCLEGEAAQDNRICRGGWNVHLAQIPVHHLAVLGKRGVEVWSGGVFLGCTVTHGEAEESWWMLLERCS